MTLCEHKNYVEEPNAAEKGGNQPGNMNFESTSLADTMAFQDVEDVDLGCKHEENGAKEHLAIICNEEGAHAINYTVHEEKSQSCSTLSPVSCDCGQPVLEKVVGDKNVNKGLRYLSCANFVPFYMKKRLKKKLLEVHGSSCHFFRWLDPPRVTYEQKKQAKEEKRVAKEVYLKSKWQHNQHVTRAAVRKEIDTFQAQEVEARRLGLKSQSPALQTRFVTKKINNEGEIVEDTRSCSKGKKTLSIFEVTEGFATRDFNCTRVGSVDASLYSSTKELTKDNARELIASSNTLKVNETSFGPTYEGAIVEPESLDTFKAFSNICMEGYDDPQYIGPSTKIINAREREEQDVELDHGEACICGSNVEKNYPCKTDCGNAVEACSDTIEAPFCDCQKEAVLKRVQKKTVNHGRLYWVCTNSVHPFQKEKRKAEKVGCKFFSWLDNPNSEKQDLKVKRQRHELDLLS